MPKGKVQFFEEGDLPRSFVDGGKKLPVSEDDELRPTYMELEEGESVEFDVAPRREVSNVLLRTDDTTQRVKSSIEEILIGHMKSVRALPIGEALTGLSGSESITDQIKASTTSHLRYLAESTELKTALARNERTAVEQLRALGLSWRAIGEALKITGQSAQQRFGNKAKK